MDAYSRYNQILMYGPDREKTTFMTKQAINQYNMMYFGLNKVMETYSRIIIKF